MNLCPEYRVRLYMSVDLIGSTAFKAAEQGRKVAENGLSSVWSTETRNFYRRFPELLHKEFDKVASGDGHATSPPRLWKTIGDEIVFCCRVVNQEHLSSCVTAFLKALHQFGKILDKSGGHLDLKGCGWIATFPTPNVALAVAGRVADASSPDLPFDEGQELSCDMKPEDFDFLGRHIDTGFRLSNYAEADRFVVSVELAYLLSDKQLPKLFSGPFDYHGRERLKGVLDERPYPIFALNTERDEISAEVRMAERALVGRPIIDGNQVRTFLEHFVLHEKIEVPVLPRGVEPVPSDALPETYRTFSQRWERHKANVDANLRTESQGAEIGNAGGTGLEERPEAFSNAIVEVTAVGRTKGKSGSSRS